jgi:hypothetical protein
MRCANCWEQILQPSPNSVEGNGKRQGLQRARFFDDARGSALECAACLDASVAKRITKERIESVLAKSCWLELYIRRKNPVAQSSRSGFRARGTTRFATASLQEIAS